MSSPWRILQDRSPPWGDLRLSRLAAAMLGVWALGGCQRSEPPAEAPEEAAADSPAVAWGDWVEVAVGDGHRGPWRMNASRFEYVDDPTVAISGDGTVVVAFADQARQDIFLRTYTRDGRPRLTEPVNVSRSPGIFSWLPRVAVAADAPREVHALWQDIVFSGGSHGGDIIYARSRDGGASFDPPQNLSRSLTGAGKGRLTRQVWHNGSLDLAVGAGGTVLAAWTEYEGGLWVARSTDRGERFAAPLRVAGDDAAPARGPSLAVAAEGTVHLVWTVGEDPAADLRMATSDDGGASFGPPRAILSGPGHADAPSLAVDDRGRLHLAYGETTRPFRYRVLYTRSSDGGLTFDPPRDLTGWQAEGSAGVGFPTLRTGAGDRVFLVWERFPAADEWPRGLGFTVSWDGGESFERPTALQGTADERGVNGGQQGLLMRKLAVGADGAIAVAHSTFRLDEESRVRLLLGRTR